MSIRKIILSFFLFFALPLYCSEKQKDSLFNPITDVCWSCMLPFHVSGANLTPSSTDYLKHKKALCHCEGGLIGLPVSYWQPNQLCEVTMTPYKLIAFGSIQLAKPNLKKRGYMRKRQDGLFEALYHVHFYEYPLLSILDSAANFACSDFMKKEIAISYMSELDPFWMDDAWNGVLYPHTLTFANPLAVAACIPDCMLSTIHKPTDKLFWCSGCQGSLFPYNGFVSHARGGIQASSLLVHRTLAKLHYLGVLWTFGKDEYCEKKRALFPPKTAYKIQLAKPVKQTAKKCPALGSNEFLWGFQKTYPGKGEEFVYVIWNRAHCCVDPYKIYKRIQTGGAL